jgi:monothiol glutaredoxin
VIVNGTMLPDISGEELEGYRLENGLVASTDNSTDIPLNAPCSDEEHEAIVKMKL